MSELKIFWVGWRPETVKRFFFHVIWTLNFDKKFRIWKFCWSQNSKKVREKIKLQYSKCPGRPKMGVVRKPDLQTKTRPCFIKSGLSDFQTFGCLKLDNYYLKTILIMSWTSLQSKSEIRTSSVFGQNTCHTFYSSLNNRTSKIGTFLASLDHFSYKICYI